MQKLKPWILILQASICYAVSVNNTCPGYSAIPENGNVFCTNYNLVGSECIFTCQPYHTLAGPRAIKCANSSVPKWTNSTTPICKVDRCDSFNAMVPGRFFACSRENQVTSVCHFKCLEPNHVLHPSSSKSIHCTKNKTWSGKIPCCALPCPPNNVVDVYLLMDSSEHVGVNEWVYMKQFIKILFGNFTISEVSTKISMLRYNSKVDEENIIYLNDYLNKPKELWYALDLLPYDGKGSNLSQALQFLIHEMMPTKAGNRPSVIDVVIIFTTGKTDDDFTSAAYDLQESGDSVMVVAVRKSKLTEFDHSRLLTLTRNTGGFIAVKDSYEELVAKGAANMTACSRSCLQDESTEVETAVYEYDYYIGAYYGGSTSEYVTGYA